MARPVSQSIRFMSLDEVGQPIFTRAMSGDNPLQLFRAGQVEHCRPTLFPKGAGGPVRSAKPQFGRAGMRSQAEQRALV